MKKIQWKKQFPAVGIVLLAASVLLVCFIFGRSLMPFDVSSAESGSVVDMLGGLLHMIGINEQDASHVVRKAAHFTEFCVLGVLLTLTAWKNGKKNLRPHIFTVLFFCLAVPVCDETIQYFSPGRSPEVADVLLDFSGAFTGVLITSLILKLLSMHKRKEKIAK